LLARGAAAHPTGDHHHVDLLVHLGLERLLRPADLPPVPGELRAAAGPADVRRPDLERRLRRNAGDVGARAAPGRVVLPRLPEVADRGRADLRVEGMRHGTSAARGCRTPG